MRIFLMLLWLTVTSAAQQATDSSQSTATGIPGLNVRKPLLSPLPALTPALPEQSISYPGHGRSAPGFQFDYHLPQNPFEIDYRESSYYVPGMVHREIEIGMGRDPGTVPLPTMYLAFLAYKLIDQYVLPVLTDREKVSIENFLRQKNDLPVLRQFWKHGSLSIDELYNQPEIREKYSVMTLQQSVRQLENLHLLEKDDSAFTERFKVWLNRAEAIDLLQKYLASGTFTSADERESVTLLLRDLNNLNLNTE